MIRIIIRRDDANMAAHAGGAVLTSYRTIDIEAPEVEEALLIGGSNDDGSFCHAQIVGAEVLLSSRLHAFHDIHGMMTR